MRRKDREVSDPQELREILEECKACRVAVKDAQGLYIVPLNFGYQYEEGKLSLFLHSARTGRKVDAFRLTGEAAFEMDCGHQLVENEKPCDHSYNYRCITGCGAVTELTDSEEKSRALSCLMRHQTGRDFSFDEKELATVAVFRLDAVAFTGKKRS